MPALGCVGGYATNTTSRDRAELQKADELSGGDTTCIAVLAYAYAASGATDGALKLLKELKSRPNHRFSYAAQEAMIYASVDDKAQALAFLEKAYDDRFDALALRSPAFDPLRSEPRFLDLVRRIGLPAEPSKAGG